MNLKTLIIFNIKLTHNFLMHYNLSTCNSINKAFKNEI